MLNYLEGSTKLKQKKSHQKINYYTTCKKLYHIYGNLFFIIGAVWTRYMYYNNNISPIIQHVPIILVLNESSDIRLSNHMPLCKWANLHIHEYSVRAKKNENYIKIQYIIGHLSHWVLYFVKGNEEKVIKYPLGSIKWE